jgi:hypothetical protein
LGEEGSKEFRGAQEYLSIARAEPFPRLVWSLSAVPADSLNWPGQLSCSFGSKATKIEKQFGSRAFMGSKNCRQKATFSLDSARKPRECHTDVHELRGFQSRKHDLSYVKEVNYKRIAQNSMQYLSRCLAAESVFISSVGAQFIPSLTRRSCLQLSHLKIPLLPNTSCPFHLRFR